MMNSGKKCGLSFEKGMLIPLFFLVVCLFSVNGQGQRECNVDYEFACNNGRCISKQQWCDNRNDCPDGSDEQYCNGAPCPVNYFVCSNGMCIPGLAKCDKYPDCSDGSDEALCEDERSSVSDGNYTASPVVKAVDYVMTQKRSDYGWGSSTARAIVSVAFAEGIRALDKDEKDLMKKHLKVQVSLELLQNSEHLSLNRLALFINALYVTCEDPRNFQGMDLVDLLRRRTDATLKGNFSYPGVLLTLCIAGEVNYEYLRKSAELYTGWSDDRIGSKALALMALTCLRKNDPNWDVTSYMQDFFRRYENLEISTVDAYTKALFIQAANAAGFRVATEGLLNQQLEDGSFGDLLGTYYAIPALLGDSLLNLKLKCNSSYEAKGQSTGLGSIFSKSNSKGKNITYSLWISSDGDFNSHTLVLTLEGNRTFYDLMRMAAAKDPVFRFMPDETEAGRKPYSIGGIPNDPEIGKFWTLYSGRADRVMVNSKRNLKEQTLGIDGFSPEEGRHYVFWWESRFI